MFGFKKRAQRQEREALDRELRNLRYTIEQRRGYIEDEERRLAEARAQGDKRREIACKQVLDTWEDGLARDLTSLHKLQ